VLLAMASALQGVQPVFWLIWLVVVLGQLKEALALRQPQLTRSAYGRHFKHQVLLGALLLLGLAIGRIWA